MPDKTNPYAPPTPAGRETRPSASSSGGLLSRLLVASAVVSAFRAALYAHGLLRWDLLPRSGGFVETASRVSWLGSLVLLAVTIAAYSFWIHGANGRARSAGAEGLQLSPGWAAAVSFIPVVNLVAPFRAVDEIREAVAPSAKLAVRVWWAFWIASLVWSVLSRFADVGIATPWSAPIHEALWAASALSLLLVVRRIERGLTASTAEPAVEPRPLIQKRAGGVS